MKNKLERVEGRFNIPFAVLSGYLRGESDETTSWIG
jgi:hypothetical protein